MLAAHGHGLVGLPRYVYNPRPGDAYGYYSAVRELLTTWRQPLVLLAAVVVVAVAGVLAVRLARRGHRAFALLAVAYGLALVGAVLAWRMRPVGAPTIGWPLVWSVPLLPYRALGLPLGPNLAFAVGLTLSLAANAVTLVATAVLGRRVTGRPLVGLGAAALYALWPFLSGLLGGHRAWENGTWLVDSGLHLYSEPVSTALVVTGAPARSRPAADRHGARPRGRAALARERRAALECRHCRRRARRHARSGSGRGARSRSPSASVRSSRSRSRTGRRATRACRRRTAGYRPSRSLFATSGSPGRTRCSGGRPCSSC